MNIALNPLINKAYWTEADQRQILAYYELYEAGVFNV
jgi:hypothetical protein